MAEPTLKASNIQAMGTQSMGYSNLNYRHSSVSPKTRAVHSSMMPSY